MDILDILVARALTPQGQIEQYAALSQKAIAKANKAISNANEVIDNIDTITEQTNTNNTNAAAALEDANAALELVNDALAQIDEQGYAMPYSADKRKLFKIGVNFSSSEKNITEWEVK